MEKELEIPNCPICGGEHTYKLKVERTAVCKWMTAADSEETTQPVKVTRIFTCPVKNEKFEGTFVLYQTSGSEIKKVEVEGAIKNE